MSVRDHPILLVEDDPCQQELTRIALDESGLAPVDLAGDRAEAIDYLFCKDRPPGPLPVVVLLDLHLPTAADGFEVLRRIRREKSTRHVPVVILSSTEDPEKIERGYALGANSFVRKPVGFDKYVEVLSRLAWYWIRINQGWDPAGEREKT